MLVSEDTSLRYAASMRPPKFEAVKLKNGNRKWPWRVYVPPDRSPTGKAQHVYGATRHHAEARAIDLIGLRQMHGNLVAGISQHDLSEAVKSLELLQPLNIGLLDAVTRFVADHNKRSQSKTLREAFAIYEALKTNRSKDYLDEFRHLKAKIDHLLDRPIVDITDHDLDEALKDCATSMRDARIRRLRSVFTMCVRKGWVTTNPANRLDISGASRDEVEIYHPDEVGRMLAAALEGDKGLVPFLAIAAFCGCRPENEVFNLDWQDVHIDDPKPEIIVRPELSKTRRRRAVEIPENCIAWIRASGVPLVGRVCPYSFSTLRRKRRTNRKLSGVELIQDGLRHSYCSAHMAKYQDVNRLLLATGHSNPSMLWRHYYRVMPIDDAQRYWSLIP
jgi:integrase